MPFLSKENFRETDDWLTSNDPGDVDHMNQEIFGNNPVPHTRTLLKAHAVYGDAGTGKPANGASANDPAWEASDYVITGDGNYSTWDGTEWVQWFA